MAPRRAKSFLLFACLLFVLALPLTVGAACTLTTWGTFCKQARGDLNWDVELNGNFDKIDAIFAGTSNTGIKIRAYTLASLPAAGNNGRLSRLTDGGCAGALIIDDGTNWRSLMEKEQKVVNPTCPPYNARGDNVTNDAAAINAAIAAMPDGGTMFFPAGAFFTGNPGTTLDFSARIGVTIQGSGHRGGFGAGTQGTLIRGTIAGDLIKYVPSGGAITIKGLAFKNESTSASAVGLHIENTVGGSLEDSNVGPAGGYGVYLPQNVFGFTISAVTFSGSLSAAPNAIGLYFAGNTLPLIGADMSGWSEAVRYASGYVNLLGGRIEVNKTGITVGMDSTGAAVNAGGGIHGTSFEANDTAISLFSTTNFSADGITVQGSVNAPSTQSLYGIRIVGSVAQSSFRNAGISGQYSRAGISVEHGSVRATWENVSVSNTFATNPKTWDVKTGLNGASYEQTFRQTNYSLRPDDASGSTFDYIQRHGRLSYLQQIDYLNGAVEGKNLRSKALAVTASATSLAVTFTGTGHGSGAADINTATATAGAGLADGTYYYRATAVTAHGESGSLNERTCVAAAGNNQCTIVFFGMTADGFKRRVYRGTATGVYDGYYETALNSNASYIDTGAAFTGKKSPGITDDTPMVEPDTNYEVFITTNWNTTWWVTSKATTGYTVNFGTSAPSDASGLVGAFYVR